MTGLWRRVRRVDLGLIVLAIASALIPLSIAGAHSLTPSTTEPPDGALLNSSPSHVRLMFAEELVAGLSGLQVFDAGGRQVDEQDGGVDLYDPDHATLVATLPPLPTGTYTVRWYAVLMDGDRIEGVYHFSVGESGAGRYTPDANLTRLEEVKPFPQQWLWLGMLALLLSAGGLGLYLWSAEYW